MSIDSPEQAQTQLRSGIAEEVRALLGRRSMSKLELARRIGKSHTYVWRRLDGETAFDTDDLERIAAVLGVSVIDLLPGSARVVSPAALLPSGGSQITAQYVAKPQARPHAVDVRSPRSGMSGSAGSRSRRSRRLVDQMAA